MAKKCSRSGCYKPVDPKNDKYCSRNCAPYSGLANPGESHPQKPKPIIIPKSAAVDTERSKPTPNRKKTQAQPKKMTFYESFAQVESYPPDACILHLMLMRDHCQKIFSKFEKVVKRPTDVLNNVFQIQELIEESIVRLKKI